MRRRYDTVLAALPGCCHCHFLLVFVGGSSDDGTGECVSVCRKRTYTSSSTPLSLSNCLRYLSNCIPVLRSTNSRVCHTKFVFAFNFGAVEEEGGTEIQCYRTQCLYYVCEREGGSFFPPSIAHSHHPIPTHTADNTHSSQPYDGGWWWIVGLVGRYGGIECGVSQLVKRDILVEFPPFAFRIPISWEVLLKRPDHFGTRAVCIQPGSRVYI